MRTRARARASRNATEVKRTEGVEAKDQGKGLVDVSKARVETFA